MKKLFAALLITALAGCATTEQSKPNTTASVGFLGDYSQLKPGTGNQFLLRYVNPNADWKKYTAITIDPVQVWDSPGSTVSKEEQTALATYYYNQLKDDLSKNFTITDQPGPNVMRLRVALTNPSAATPVLRTISVVVPEAHVLNVAKNLATGSYAFVGGAQSEGEVVDSVTGVRLAAAVDKRAGTASLKNADVWEWGDAQDAINYWANATDDRLVQLRNNGALASQ